jgi:hypothetical protein
MAASCGGEISENAPSDGAASDGAPTDAHPVPSDATPDTNCTILASNYDQTCSNDSDCVASVGMFAVNLRISNYCTNRCLCMSDAINKKSAAQYLAAISNTPYGSGAFPPWLGCSCTLPGGPCCQGGTCTLDCNPEVDSGEGDSSEGTIWDAAALDGSVPCPPAGAAVPDGGQARSCIPGQQCLMFNGGWACCLMFGEVYQCN